MTNFNRASQRARSVRVAWFFIGLIAGLVIAAVVVSA